MAGITPIADEFRTGKAYTIRQAAALAHVSGGTVRNWLYGSPKSDMEPVFGSKEKSDEIARVSFLELSELLIAAQWRKKKIKLQRVRAAHSYARTEWDVQYPFAHLDLTTVGGHILRRFEETHPDMGPSFLVMTAPNQYVIPGIVQDEIDRFDYSPDDQFAARWYPDGKDVPIVVDPHFGGGRPTIKGRGVTVDIIKRRFTIAKESIASIARDFKLPRDVVEEVVRVRAA